MIVVVTCFRESPRPRKGVAAVLNSLDRIYPAFAARRRAAADFLQESPGRVQIFRSGLHDDHYVAIGYGDAADLNTSLRRQAIRLRREAAEKILVTPARLPKDDRYRKAWKM